MPVTFDPVLLCARPYTLLDISRFTTGEIGPQSRLFTSKAVMCACISVTSISLCLCPAALR